MKIYSKNDQKWFVGKIAKIDKDSTGEWLLVIFKNDGGKIFSKQIQRFSDQIRPYVYQKFNVCSDSLLFFEFCTILQISCLFVEIFCFLLRRTDKSCLLHRDYFLQKEKNFTLTTLKIQKVMNFPLITMTVMINVVMTLAKRILKILTLYEFAKDRKFKKKCLSADQGLHNDAEDSSVLGLDDELSSESHNLKEENFVLKYQKKLKTLTNILTTSIQKIGNGTDCINRDEIPIHVWELIADFTVDGVQKILVEISGSGFCLALCCLEQPPCFAILSK